jgi:hypothetical protein
MLLDPPTRFTLFPMIADEAIGLLIDDRDE